MSPSLKAQLMRGMRPQLGQLMIWALILIATTRTYTKLPEGDGEPLATVSLLSFLPAQVLSDPFFFQGMRWVLVVAGLLWALNLLVPLSSWLTVIAFTSVVALYYENSSHIAHTYNLSVFVLFIHAVWYHFRRHEIRAALSDGTFWHRKMYPGWVFHLSIFCVAIFHTYAGLSKLAVSGLDWANGLSLQLWVHLWGVDSIFRDQLLSSRGFAMTLQVGTLIIETSAILAIFSQKLRWTVGLLLCGLYTGILLAFNFQFEYNALIVAALLLPTYEVLDSFYGWSQKRFGVTLRINRNGMRYRLLRPLLNRLDIFGFVALRPKDGAQILEED